MSLPSDGKPQGALSHSSLCAVKKKERKKKWKWYKVQGTSPCFASVWFIPFNLHRENQFRVCCPPKTATSHTCSTMLWQLMVYYCIVTFENVCGFFWNFGLNKVFPCVIKWNFILTLIHNQCPFFFCTFSFRFQFNLTTATCYSEMCFHLCIVRTIWACEVCVNVVCVHLWLLSHLGSLLKASLCQPWL